MALQNFKENSKLSALKICCLLETSKCGCDSFRWPSKRIGENLKNYYDSFYSFSVLFGNVALLTKMLSESHLFILRKLIVVGEVYPETWSPLANLQRRGGGVWRGDNLELFKRQHYLDKLKAYNFRIWNYFKCVSRCLVWFQYVHFYQIRLTHRNSHS